MANWVFMQVTHVVESKSNFALVVFGGILHSNFVIIGFKQLGRFK